jgi:anti-sigma factor RsiW
MNTVDGRRCPDDVLLIDALLDEAAGTRTEYAAHIASCGECAARAGEWRDMLHLLREDALAETPAPPADLAPAILCAIRAERRRDVRPRALLQRHTWRRGAGGWLRGVWSPGRAWATAAVLVLILAGAAGVFLLGQDRAPVVATVPTPPQNAPMTIASERDSLQGTAADESDLPEGTIGEWTTWDDQTVGQVGKLVAQELDVQRVGQLRENAEAAQESEDIFAGLEDLSPQQRAWLLHELERQMGGET